MIYSCYALGFKRGLISISNVIQACQRDTVCINSDLTLLSAQDPKVKGASRYVKL